MIYLGKSASVPMLFGQFPNSSGFDPKHKNRCPFPLYIAASFQHLGTVEVQLSTEATFWFSAGFISVTYLYLKSVNDRVSMARYKILDFPQGTGS